MNKFIINAGVVSLAIFLSTAGWVMALMQEWVTIPGNPNTVFEDIPTEGSDLRLNLDAQSGYAIDSSDIALEDGSDTVQWQRINLQTYEIGTVLSSREWLSVTGTYHKITGGGGGGGTPPTFNAKVAAPDVDMGGLTEENEETVGVWLAKDGARKTVTVHAVKQRGPSSQQTLTWSSGNLSLWTAAIDGDMLPGNSKSDISADQGATYYAQGINANGSVRGSEIVAEYTVNSQIARDRVNLTVVGATISPFSTILVNATNDVSVTLLPNPPGTNITLQISCLSSGSAVFVPSEMTTSNITQSATVKIKGVTASSVASNMMLKAMMGSDILASNVFTVVGMEFGSGFERVAPTKTQTVSVVTLPSPLPSGVSVSLSAVRTYGNEGLATVNPSTITCSTNVNVTGGEQSWGSGTNAAPTNMVLVAQLQGYTVTNTTPFTVCAHAVNFQQTNSATLDGGVIKFWYAWNSDSGDCSHLNKVWLGEHVTYSDGGIHIGTNRPWKANSTNPTIEPSRVTLGSPAASGEQYDTHYPHGGLPYPGPADSYDATQHYGYRCFRCNPGAVNDTTLGWQQNLLGPITISRFVEQVGTNWQYRIQKSGVTNTAILAP